MFSLKLKPLLFTYHRGQSEADRIRSKNNIIALWLDILLLKRAGTEAGAQHLGAAGKQAASLWGVPSAFLVWMFLKQQGGTAGSVDSTFFGNSQTWQS